MHVRKWEKNYEVREYNGKEGKRKEEKKMIFRERKKDAIKKCHDDDSITPFLCVPRVTLFSSYFSHSLWKNIICITTITWEHEWTREIIKWMQKVHKMRRNPHYNFFLRLVRLFLDFLLLVFNPFGITMEEKDGKKLEKKVIMNLNYFSFSPKPNHSFSCPFHLHRGGWWWSFRPAWFYILRVCKFLHKFLLTFLLSLHCSGGNEKVNEWTTKWIHSHEPTSHFLCVLLRIKCGSMARVKKSAFNASILFPKNKKYMSYRHSGSLRREMITLFIAGCMLFHNFILNGNKEIESFYYYLTLTISLSYFFSFSFSGWNVFLEEKRKYTRRNSLFPFLKEW